LVVILAALLVPAVAQAGFGLKSLEVSSTNEDETVDLQAGSHPYGYTINFEMNQDSEENPEGSIHSLIFKLPPGIVGNPQAVPHCPGSLFDGQASLCPGNTQVGVAHIRAAAIGGTATSPIYNLTPGPGVPASFGFSIVGFNSFQEASLRTGGDYGVNVSDITVPEIAIQSVSATIWGVPVAAGHDAERECTVNGSRVLGCSTDLPPVPFLTLPTSCTGPLTTTVSVESIEEPGVFQSKSAESLGFGGTPAGLSGCGKPAFEPTIAVQPETTSADSPTGLHVHLHIPQNEAPEGIATAHLRDSVVTLPAGLAVNPSAADGLGACSQSQIDLQGPGAAQCPPDSKVGTVQVETPLLDHPLPGSVYIAKQGENPFNALIGLYIAVDDPLTGVVVKLAGKVEPDPVSGQLRASFKDNPQLPFEDFNFDFTGGPRAALTTPSTCGRYTTTTDLTPWTSPSGADAFPSDSFQVSGGAQGGRCANNEGEMPNKPSFEAGTTTPLAGTYSPFVLKLNRENGSQRLRALNVTLPPGVSAKLAGVAECSNGQIAVAEGRKNLGEGALEKASPSCPAASEIGVVNVGAGSGNPFFVQGHAYLAGPYKGAPLSLAIITPAVAGPFDLGTVVVRAALYVNESTAQVTAKSDPIPTILQGIPLDVRSIAMQIDRQQFTLNPTSCEGKAIAGEAISTSGAAAALSNRFQVGACAALDFKPDLKINLKGGTKRHSFPALKATVTYPTKGSYANIARAAVTLPRSEFLEQGHIGTVCTRVQFAANACPARSIYGHARAITPLLAKPLEGPVYLRSSSHELPDLVADLNGQIHIVLAGRIDSVKGQIRNTFEGVPDAPVSKFVLEMKGGKKGLLVNSTNICKSTYRATVKLTAQNGRVHNFNPPVGNSCKKK
jgi:hypothetical protein